MGGNGAQKPVALDGEQRTLENVPLLQRYLNDFYNITRYRGVDNFFVGCAFMSSSISTIFQHVRRAHLGGKMYFVLTEIFDIQRGKPNPYGSPTLCRSEACKSQFKVFPCVTYFLTTLRRLGVFCLSWIPRHNAWRAERSRNVAARLSERESRGAKKLSHTGNRTRATRVRV